MSFLSRVFAPRYVAVWLPTAGMAIMLAALRMDAAAPSMAAAALIAAACVFTIGVHDVLQKKHAVLRNYPVFGRFRFMLERIRPELRQYFFEGEHDGQPFSRTKRALVYQRAKGALDTRPFGTQLDVYAEGYEWMNHSMQPAPICNSDFRVSIGGPLCLQPYDASLLNISAMSYGALSAAAVRALNAGAKGGRFAHDTGEGGVSAHHLVAGGDLIWEIGSGYFGCRGVDGGFDAEKFSSVACNAQIKMVEIKLSQGAKPGHGGMLPASKVTPEIAAIRGIPVARDCISPAAHAAFSTPFGLLDFIARLRQLSHGKPVGFKLCIGQKLEFMAIVKAMVETGILPDFIVVDGNEGGTGAAPAEFADNLGTPLREGLNFVNSCLIAAGLRENIKLGCAGKIITGFDMACAIALGADWCNMARGFMFALGCIQAQACHTGRCPTGVATQDTDRQRAIHIPTKAERVTRFHAETLKAFAELIGACGISSPREIDAHHVSRRTAGGEILTLARLYPVPAERAFLMGLAPQELQALWNEASGTSFSRSPGGKPHREAVVEPPTVANGAT